MEPLELKDRALIERLGSGNVSLFLETNLIPQKGVKRMTPAIREEKAVISDMLHSIKLTVSVLVIWNADKSHIHWIDESQSVNSYTVLSSVTNQASSTSLALPKSCLIGYYTVRRDAVRAMRGWAYSEETVNSMFPIRNNQSMYRLCGRPDDIPIIGRDVSYNKIF